MLDGSVRMAGSSSASLLVAGVFGLVLPRVADYGAVWDVISGLSTVYVAVLAATAVVNLLTFAPPWMAALPRLGFINALVMSQASTAASNVLPGGDAIGMAVSYSMLRRWGYRIEQVAIATGAFSVWNVIANVCFAVVGVGLLALGGESDPLLTTAALDRRGGCGCHGGRDRARAARRAARDPDRQRSLERVRSAGRARCCAGAPCRGGRRASSPSATRRSG